MKQKFLLIPLLLAACLISACSGDPGEPTEAEARTAVEQQIQTFSQGCIKLVAFHKADTIEMASVLIVNATAEIEFLEDCNWPVDTEVIALKIAPGTIPNVKNGERRTMKLTVQFHKTARGWKATK